MSHQIDVSLDNRTLWVNGSDGSCLARFDKRFGMDIHNPASEMIAGKQQCLYCTHEPATFDDFRIFCQKVFEHHKIVVSSNILRWD